MQNITMVKKFSVVFFIFVLAVVAGADVLRAQGVSGSKALLRAVSKGKSNFLKPPIDEAAVRKILERQIRNEAMLQYDNSVLRELMARDLTQLEERNLPQYSKELPERKGVFTVIPENTIMPTAENQLMAAMLSSKATAERVSRNLRFVDLEIMSPAAARETYYARMREFREMAKYIHIKLFYSKVDGLTPKDWNLHERNTLRKDLILLRNRLKFLSLYYFPEDVPLYQATKYLLKLILEIEPMYRGVLDKLPAFSRTDRVFNKNEFMLVKPEGFPEKSELPPN